MWNCLVAFSVLFDLIWLGILVVFGGLNRNLSRNFWLVLGPWIGPLQPHWLQQPLKPNFLKKLPNHDGLINKITNNCNCLWNASSKIQFFTNIWHPFWGGPLRLHLVKKFSNGGLGIKFHYSGFPNYLQTKSNLHISICQSQIH